METEIKGRQRNATGREFRWRDHGQMCWYVNVRYEYWNPCGHHKRKEPINYRYNVASSTRWMSPPFPKPLFTKTCINYTNIMLDTAHCFGHISNRRNSWSRLSLRGSRPMVYQYSKYPWFKLNYRHSSYNKSRTKQANMTTSHLHFINLFMWNLLNDAWIWQ